MSNRFNMTIGGESVDSHSHIEIRNPADTEEVIGKAPVATSQHLNQSFDAAAAAFDSWRYSSDADRTNACKEIARVCTENAESKASRCDERCEPLQYGY